MARHTWALLDFDGQPIRFYNFEADGTVPWPPQHYSLPPGHPEWDNPLF